MKKTRRDLRPEVDCFGLKKKKKCILDIGTNITDIFVPCRGKNGYVSIDIKKVVTETSKLQIP